jgi:hypothetical protein
MPPGAAYHGPGDEHVDGARAVAGALEIAARREREDEKDVLARGLHAERRIHAHHRRTDVQTSGRAGEEVAFVLDERANRLDEEVLVDALDRQTIR